MQGNRPFPSHKSRPTLMMRSRLRLEYRTHCRLPPYWHVRVTCLSSSLKFSAFVHVKFLCLYFVSIDLFWKSYPAGASVDAICEKEDPRKESLKEVRKVLPEILPDASELVSRL